MLKLFFWLERLQMYVFWHKIGKNSWNVEHWCFFFHLDGKTGVRIPPSTPPSSPGFKYCLKNEQSVLIALKTRGEAKSFYTL